MGDPEVAVAGTNYIPHGSFSLRKINLHGPAPLLSYTSKSITHIFFYTVWHDILIINTFLSFLHACLTIVYIFHLTKFSSWSTNTMYYYSFLIFRHLAKIQQI